MLSVIVAVGMGAILVAASGALGRLAGIVNAQSINSSVSFAATGYRQQVSLSWITLYRLDHEVLTGASTAPQTRENYEGALATASFALDGLLAFNAEAATQASFKTLKSAHDAYVNDSTRAAAILAGQTEGRTASAIQDASLSFSVLSAELIRLENILRQESVRLADSGRREAAAASSVVTFLSLGILLIVLAISVATTLSITRPLGSLVAAVGTVAQGDFSMDVVTKGRGEIGFMAEGVNSLVRDLRGLLGTVKDRLASLEGTGHGLASAMEQTGAAVIEINANIASTGGQLDEQSSAVEEVSAGMEELTRNVESLSALIARQAAEVEESSASVDRIIASVQSSAERAGGAALQSKELAARGEEGKSRIDGVDKAIDAIVESARNLDKATTVISEIAERTTLLAMNAAIEAAHAGASGRGFGVVAQEIRKLAIQSTAQARDISGDLARVGASIEGVRGATSQAVASFGSILERSRSLSESMEALGSTMTEEREEGRQVLERLASLQDITQEIRRGSGEMASANESILGHAQRLREVNSLVVRNMAEITMGTKDINEAVTQTIDLCSRNGELIGEVREASDRFVLETRAEAPLPLPGEEAENGEGGDE